MWIQETLFKHDKYEYCACVVFTTCVQSLVPRFLILMVKGEQEPAATCLVGIQLGLPVINKGAAHAVSAEGGGFRQARLSAPINGA